MGCSNRCVTFPWPWQTFQYFRIVFLHCGQTPLIIYLISSPEARLRYMYSNRMDAIKKRTILHRHGLRLGEPFDLLRPARNDRKFCSGTTSILWSMDGVQESYELNCELLRMARRTTVLLKCILWVIMLPRRPLRRAKISTELQFFLFWGVFQFKIFCMWEEIWGNYVKAHIFDIVDVFKVLILLAYISGGI
jgi:hypothetical protein